MGSGQHVTIVDQRSSAAELALRSEIFILQHRQPGKLVDVSILATVDSHPDTDAALILGWIRQQTTEAGFLLYLFIFVFRRRRRGTDDREDSGFGSLSFFVIRSLLIRAAHERLRTGSGSSADGTSQEISFLPR